jgi:hypothetical protein
MTNRLNRRTMVKAALAGAGVAAVAADASAQGKAKAAVEVVRPDGTYAAVPLRKPQIRVTALQTALLNVQVASAEADLKRNLNHVLDQIDACFNYFGEKDLVTVNSFALHGWDKWTKSDLQKIALRVPGPQADAICGRAKQYNCYIAFGGYAILPDWPGHVVDIYYLAGPDGTIVSQQWKATTQRSQRDNADFFVTHVVDVMDAFVERYGLDAVLPVARTDIGNIALSAVFREPELFRALAFKGAEVFVRSGLGGFTDADGILTSRVNRAFTLYMSNALSPGNPKYFPDNGFLGNTSVYGLRGEKLATSDKHETAVNAVLDIAGRRAPATRIPDVSFDLYKHVYDQYRSRFAPNAYGKAAPENFEDASRLMRSVRRWQS